MATKIHFREHINNQMVLFPQRIDKDIAQSDPVRLVNAVVDGLSLENFKRLYNDRGRIPYHPRMMLKVIIYSYMNNIYSCRKIEKALLRDVHFIWLAGYEQPDFINRFRNRVKDEINNVFTQLVLQLAERGLVSLDGTVDVTDINIVVNIILGKDNAANYDGRADVNNSGVVDVSDVNILVNIILGKN